MGLDKFSRYSIFAFCQRRFAQPDHVWMGALNFVSFNANIFQQLLQHIRKCSTSFIYSLFVLHCTCKRSNPCPNNN